jgi:hypothetical protein
LQNQCITSPRYGEYRYPSDAAFPIHGRERSRFSTPTRMSMTGLAGRPGTEVLPT